MMNKELDSLIEKSKIEFEKIQKDDLVTDGVKDCLIQNSLSKLIIGVKGLIKESRDSYNDINKNISLKSVS